MGCGAITYIHRIIEAPLLRGPKAVLQDKGQPTPQKSGSMMFVLGGDVAGNTLFRLQIGKRAIKLPDLPANVL